MRLAVLILAMTLLAWPPAAGAQARRAPARRPAAAAAAPPRTEPAMMMCPDVLGQGVTTKQTFCDVMTGRDPAGGIIVTLPPHVGPVTLTFDLHNRHTYSEELVREHKAYSRYTATIGVLTMDNTLLSRAIIENEFRTAADLVDRISGGTGPGGVKAVAPTGTEMVSVEIPQGENAVSILGEKLTVLRPDGVDNFNATGRPIALISNVMVTYRPAPPKRAPAPRTRRR